MDSGPVKPARRWPLLPTRKAGEPATVPVSPTKHINPAVGSGAPGNDSRGERRREKPPAEGDADEHPGENTGSGAHRIDRSV